VLKRTLWHRPSQSPISTKPFLRLQLATMAVVSDQSAAANAESGASMAKLHGRAFYESIGSPKYVVAPMVDQSEFVSHMLVIPQAALSNLVDLRF
jgi:hypothetical protein